MRSLLTFILITALMLPAYAGDPTRKGTDGAQQLLIPVGAQGIATGGAFLANVTGLESLYYNPAGFDIAQRTEAMFGYMNYIADINVSYFAAGTNLGELGSFALSFKSLDFGDIEETTVESPDGTGRTYSPGFYTLGITYSKVITDRVSTGVNIKLVNESIMNTSAFGVAFDFGVQYRFENNLSLSATVKNVGTNMNYTGSDLYDKTVIPGTQAATGDGQYQIVTETYQMPSFFELSVGYTYDLNKTNSLAVAGTFVNNNSYEDELKLGLEYGFMNTFYVRGGYYMFAENTDMAIYDFTAGAGVNYQTQTGIGIAFDYAFRNVKDFDANHVFTVKLFMP